MPLLVIKDSDLSQEVVHVGMPVDEWLDQGAAFDEIGNDIYETVMGFQITPLDALFIHDSELIQAQRKWYSCLSWPNRMSW